MSLKFRPLLPTVQVLSKSVNFGGNKARYGSEIQTTIADFTITNQKVNFGGIITTYLSDIQTTVADFTITNQKRQFWKNNNKIWV